MTLRMRCGGRLALGVDLQDRWTGNDVLVVDLGGGFGEHNVDLAEGAGGDGVDLEVFVAGCDADFDWELKRE